MSTMTGSFGCHAICDFFNVKLILRLTEELLIDFRELVGEHSGENLAAAVWDTLELYDLKGRVHSSSI